jgi:hypothetical protein
MIVFEVKVKQSPAVIFTEDVTLINKEFSLINQVLYQNNSIKYINKVK